LKIGNNQVSNPCQIENFSKNPTDGFHNGRFKIFQDEFLHKTKTSQCNEQNHSALCGVPERCKEVKYKECHNVIHIKVNCSDFVFLISD
jgi:hypothetical protein